MSVNFPTSLLLLSTMLLACSSETEAPSEMETPTGSNLDDPQAMAPGGASSSLQGEDGLPADAPTGMAGSMNGAAAAGGGGNDAAQGGAGGTATPLDITEPSADDLARLEQARGAKPNIIFAIADDWSHPHASVYGDAVVKTPTMERMAQEGVIFEHAYVTAPSCAPSRASVLTGQWHWRLGEAANLYGPIDLEHQLYTDALREAGYFVGMTRKGWGPGNNPGREHNPAGESFGHFDQFLAERPAGAPFVFWFGSTDPHRPYDPGSGAGAGIAPAAVEPAAHFPDAEAVRSDIADYYFEVQRFDREVGEIMDAVEALGELENTLVVITSDNGMPFPRCKATLYDCGSRVPLAVRWPGKVPGQRRIDDFVSLVDMAPTFLEAAGVDLWPELSGASLLPLITREAEGRLSAERGFVLTGKERHVPGQEGDDSGGTPMRAIRTHEALFIRNYEPDRWPSGTPNYQNAFITNSWFADVDNGPTKCYMNQNQDKNATHRMLFELSFAKRPAEELYVLADDPAQMVNVADDPNFADLKQQLSAQLDEALQATGDPRAAAGGQMFDGYPYTGGSPKWQPACAAN